MFYILSNSQMQPLKPVFGPTKAIVKLILSENMKSAELLREVQLLRASISPSMIGKIDAKQRLEFMKQLWTILFKIAENCEPAVYVSVCSAVGAILFAIFPFFPYTTAESFAIVSAEMMEVSNASIVVISAFLNIVNSMSPARLPDFLGKTQVLMMHFSADVSGVIQHLPGLIHLMGPLEVEFHRNLLRSLVTSFWKNPHHYFVDSVVNLVSLEPKVLLGELLQYIESNKLWKVLLALGPKLLADEKLFEMVGDAKESFIRVALEAIGNKDSQLVDFEQACNTLSNIIQQVDGSELEELRRRIDEVRLSEYPRHYQRFLLLLANNVEELLISEGDSRTLCSAKLAALSKYLQKSRDAHALEIATTMVTRILTDESDDVLTTAIILVSECFELLLSHNREATKLMLSTILKRNNMSWVQNREALYCVMKIDCDVACELIEGLDRVVIEKSLELSLSKSDELSNVAISCLKLYVNKENLHQTIIKIMSVDAFDEQSAVKLIRVMDALYEGLPSSEFDKLAPWVIEIVTLHDDPLVAGAGFSFLSNLGYFNVTVDFLNCCIDWIVRLQKSVIQNDSSISSPLKNTQDLPKILNCIETDIVAVPICQRRETALKPLESCLKYFLSLTSTSDKRAIKFMEDLIFLFPEAILPRAIEYMSIIPKSFHHVVSMIANFTNSAKCAAVCCDFLCFVPMEFRTAAVPTVRFLIESPKVDSGAIIFSFSRFLHFSDVNDADELLSRAKARLNDTQKATIEAKMCVNDKDRLNVFTSTTPFAQWPVADEDFCLSLKLLDERCTVSEFSDLDFVHWKYLYEHIDQFELVGFETYRESHKYSLKKFEAPDETAEKPQITLVDMEKTSQHPLVVEIIRDQYKFDKFLVKSFLKFTKYKLTQEQFDRVFVDVVNAKDPDVIRIAITYASDNNIAFDKKFLLDNAMETVKSSPSLLAALASKLTVEDVELPDDIDIGSLQLNEFDWNSLAMYINGNKYLMQYLPTMHIKSSNLRHLTKVLSRFPLSGETVITFCAKHFHTILQSEKRLVSCLRLLRVAMSNVRGSHLLFGKLYAFLDSESALVHMELSKLLLPILVDVELNSGIIEWLEKANTISQVFSPYLTVMSALYAYTKCPVHSLTDATFTDLLGSSFDLPSVMINVFSAIEALVKGNPAGWALFTCISLSFFAVAAKLQNLPIFDTKIDFILRLLIRRPDFHAHLGLFLPRICELIFSSRPNTPSFPGRMSVLTTLIPLIPKSFRLYQNFIDSVLQSPDKDPRSLSVIFDGYRWSIGREKGDAQAAEMTIAMVKYAFKYVVEFNRDENIAAFMDSLWLPHCDFETAFTGIWKLSLLDFPVLKVIVMMHLFKKRCSPEQIETCKGMISCFYDSFEDKKYVKALEMVFNGDPIGAVLLLFD